MRNNVLLGSLAAFAFAATAQAATVTLLSDTNIVDTIPGLTGFATSGNEMSGMKVTATFSAAGAQIATWVTLDDASELGGAFTGAWGLFQAGDTFSQPWAFAFLGGDTGLGQLVSLTLEGAPGFTLFDRTEPNTGTPDSAEGKDFEFFGGSEYDVTVTYSHVVAVGPNPFVGDEFHVVSIDFGDGGPRANAQVGDVGFAFAFLQDADNDSRILVPEPATLALLGAGMLGLGLQRRVKR